MRRTMWQAGFLYSFWAGAATSFATPFLEQRFTATAVGLYDSDHEYFGRATSTATRLLADGTVLGLSQHKPQYMFGTYSVWRQKGPQVQRLGIFDELHTGIYGIQTSVIVSANPRGDVAGQSSKFSSGYVDVGTTAWLSTATGLRVVGLSGPEYATQSFAGSRIAVLTETGVIAGDTDIAHPSGQWRPGGSHAWVDDGSGARRVGLEADVLPVVPGAGQLKLGSSSAIAILSDGTVVGKTSATLESPTWYGYETERVGSALWQSDGASARRLGIYDSIHTSDSGRQYSDVVRVTPSGRIVGWSERRGQPVLRTWAFGNPGDGRFGRTAWLTTSTGTTELGLTGAAYVNSAGVSDTIIMEATDDTVVGNTAKFDGATEPVWQGWVFRDGSYQALGLTDARHTAANGLTSSYARYLTRSGDVIGFSARYSAAGSGLGQSCWRSTTGGTRKIGLTGGRNTTPDGREVSDVVRALSDGTVYGRSQRYNSSGLTDIYDDYWVDVDGETRRLNIAPVTPLTDLHFTDETSAYPSDWGDTLGQVSVWLLEDNGDVTEVERYHWYYVASQRQVVRLDGVPINGNLARIEELATVAPGVLGGVYSMPGENGASQSGSFLWEFGRSLIDPLTLIAETAGSATVKSIDPMTFRRLGDAWTVYGQVANTSGTRQLVLQPVPEPHVAFVVLLPWLGLRRKRDRR